MKLKKEYISTLKLESSSVGGAGSSGGQGRDPGEPEAMYIPDGRIRILNDKQGKAEPWFSNGGYTQMQFPQATNIFGAGSGKDVDSQHRVVTTKIKNTGVKYELDLNPTFYGYVEFEDLKEVRKAALSILKNIQMENLKNSNGSLTESTFVFHYGQGRDKFAHELKAFSLKTALKSFIDMYNIPKSEWDKIVVKKRGMF
jgi:hypothetical protein